MAAFLMKHSCVKDVLFPGKGGCDSASLATHCSQASGQGSMISLTTGSVEFSRRFCDACRIFKTTVSPVCAYLLILERSHIRISGRCPRSSAEVCNS